MSRLAGLILAALACAVSPASAQIAAAVQGVVSDASGSRIPGASVLLVNLETGVRQESETNESGLYRFGSLPPGRYSVTVQRAGFQKAVYENVVVHAEQTRGLNIELKLAAVEESVTVQADPPALQTEGADVSRAITTTEITRLPQFGRDPYELVRLAPGVFGNGARSGTGGAVSLPNAVGPGGSGSSIFQVENQVQVSANGQRISSNNFQIDGVRVNSLGWGGAAVVTPNQESVQEIQVLANSYSAEDGRNSGAHVKVVSRTGTNDLHGSGFFKYQEPGLNAYNRYGGPNNAPFLRVGGRYRQFGGSLGGPVVKNKLFLFGSYEGVRSNETSNQNTYVETPEFRSLVRQLRPNSVTSQIFAKPGIEPRIATVIPADCGVYGTNADTRCRVVAGGLDIGSPTGALGTYVPGANPIGGGFDGVPDIQFVQLNLPNRIRAGQYNFRTDYHRGSDVFAVSTYLSRRDDSGSDGGGRSRPMADLKNSPANSAATVLWNRTVSPRMLNEARLNFTRFSFDQVSASGDTDFGIPRVEVEALPFDRIRFGANRGETTPAVFAQNTYGFADTLSYVTGRHALKFGTELHWEQNNNNLLGGARPVYSFTGMWNLVNDTPIYEGINADPVTGKPTDLQRYFRTRDYALFVQDDWKVTPELTLNLGVRYEYFSPLREAQNRISTLEFGPNQLVDSKVVVVDRLHDPDRNNFGPRVGLAWNPKMLERKLVLRGGFAVYYNRHNPVAFSNVRGNPPYFSRFGLCCASDTNPFVNGQIQYVLGTDKSPFSYPVNSALAVGLDPVTNSPKGRTVEIYATRPQVPNPYVYVFSLDGEYMLPARFVATLGYQGSSSHKLLRTVNQRWLYPQMSPAFNAVYFPLPDVNANFHAMNARLTRQFSQGFRIDASYRWARSMDQGSGEFGAPTNQTYPIDLASEYGPSDYDVKHYFLLAGIWESPAFAGNPVLKHVLGGWQINGILTAHSGFPWTPLTGQALSIPSLSPTRPAGVLKEALKDTSNEAFMRPDGNFPGGGNLYFDITTKGAPGVGRNSLRGPGYFSTDASLAKDFPLNRIGMGEASRLNFRANFFNLFNKLNLQPFGFSSSSTRVENRTFFGRAERALAGRTVELQARISF